MKNCLLCIDMTVNLTDDAYIVPRKKYNGVLHLIPSDHEDDLCDGELTFEETHLTGSVRRNVCRFNGEHITATQRADGSPRLNFRTLKLDGDFNIDRFAFEVMDEIRQALQYFFDE